MCVRARVHAQVGRGMGRGGEGEEKYLIFQHNEL